MSTRRQHEHQLVVTVLRVRREGQAAACLSAASRDSPARPTKLTVAQLPGLLHPLRAPPTAGKLHASRFRLLPGGATCSTKCAGRARTG